MEDEETIKHLQANLVEYRNTLIFEGILDVDLYRTFDSLFHEQSELDDFMDGYYRHTRKSINILRNFVRFPLKRPDILTCTPADDFTSTTADDFFQFISDRVMDVKNSAQAMGLSSISTLCDVFHYFVIKKNLKWCSKSVQQLEYASYILEGKLKHLITLEQQVLAAGGFIPEV